MLFVIVHLILHVVWAFITSGVLLGQASRRWNFLWLCSTATILLYGAVVAGIFTVELVDAKVGTYIFQAYFTVIEYVSSAAWFRQQRCLNLYQLILGHNVTVQDKPDIYLSTLTKNVWFFYTRRIVSMQHLPKTMRTRTWPKTFCMANWFCPFTFLTGWYFGSLSLSCGAWCCQKWSAHRHP